jgi:hypothetical protein
MSLPGSGSFHMSNDNFYLGDVVKYNGELAKIIGVGKGMKDYLLGYKDCPRNIDARSRPKTLVQYYWNYHTRQADYKYSYATSSYDKIYKCSS